MKKPLITFAWLLLCAARPVPISTPIAWNDNQLDRLTTWINTAPKEALNVPAANDLSAARKTGEPEKLQLAATEAALRLANAYLFGTATAKERTGWNIVTDDDEIDLRAFLTASLAKNDLDGFFRALRPQHKDYDELRLAYASERDPARRAKLARNLERWRWMPLSMGNRYLLVNTASYEVGLWENGHKVKSWPVIVGKPRTSTPVFSATVTGVTYNPWWDIPGSIVAESVGALTRKNPAEAKRRGYVWGDGHYRQRPGPKNALGLMKLVMPNPYNVYLHDTPNKALFEKPSRAFSHGCIRVGVALDFASTLLAGTMGQPQIDAILSSGKTTSVMLNQAMPVYITYFTADSNEARTVRFHPDHYGRDAIISSGN
jgi:L,D-transpeptidase YcbB